MPLIKDWDSQNPEAGLTRENVQFCCSYSITDVATPDGNGKMLKYDLRKTDTKMSSSVRAELQLKGTDAPETSERWYGLRYFLEKYDADGGAESILQWHDRDDTTPPLSIQVQSGRLNITQSFNTGNLHYDLGPSTIGKWINIVIHVKWTTGNTGLLEVWRDGVKMVDKKNVRTNSKSGSYMKIGINKWSWAPGGGASTATQRIFYIDQFRMGDELCTIADVQPKDGVQDPPVPVPNKVPIANAGVDQTITVGESAMLVGLGSDSDGVIVKYEWSGTTGTIDEFNSATTSVSNLPVGKNVFMLKVYDDKLATSVDTCVITVKDVDPIPDPVKEVTAVGVTVVLSNGKSVVFK